MYALYLRRRCVVRWETRCQSRAKEAAYTGTQNRLLVVARRDAHKPGCLLQLVHLQSRKLVAQVRNYLER